MKRTTFEITSWMNTYMAKILFCVVKKRYGPKTGCRVRDDPGVLSPRVKFKSEVNEIAENVKFDEKIMWQYWHYKPWRNRRVNAKIKRSQGLNYRDWRFKQFID